MKIAVVGLGGVGGYIGAKLKSSTDSHITFIAKGSHLEAIKRDGLTLIDNDIVSNIKADDVCEKPDKKVKFDVVFVALKSYDYDSISYLKDNLTMESIVVAIGNGVENAERLEKILGQKVLNSTIYILSNIIKSGVIKRYSNTFYFIIESNNSNILSNILTEAKLKHKISKNIELDVWKKYLFISSFATLTSYYDLTIGAILEQKFNELQEVLLEIKSLANALNIFISDSDIDSVIEQAKNIPYESTTSMQLDFRAKKRAELENLTGYIVKKGKEAKTKTDKIENLYNELKRRSSVWM